MSLGLYTSERLVEFEPWTLQFIHSTLFNLRICGKIIVFTEILMFFAFRDFF